MSGPPLEEVVAAGGAALSGAQRELVGDALATRMAVSEVELEVKAGMSRDELGGLTISPISSADLASGAISPGLVSTMKVRYTAFAEDAPAATPGQSKAEVIDEVKGLEDVARLDRILGGLELDATFVPGARRWLVTATDAEGRTVREVVVEDRRRS